MRWIVLGIGMIGTATLTGCGAGPAPVPPTKVSAADSEAELRKLGGAVAEQAADHALERLTERAERKPPLPVKGVPRPKANWGKLGKAGVGLAFELIETAVERRAEQEAGLRILRDQEAARVATLKAKISGPAPTIPPSIPTPPADKFRLPVRTPFPVVRKPAAADPFVGVWDVALTPTGASKPLPAKLASFHGDGRYTMGIDLELPTLTLLYRSGAGGLCCRRDEQATEDVLPVTWDEPKGSFTMPVPQGTLTFHRRSVAAEFKDVKADVGGPPGKSAVDVRAFLRVDHAPGLPLEARCRVYDDDGRPVKARQGSPHADPDGLLAITVPFTPPHNWTEYKVFPVTVPLSELPDGFAGREIRFTLTAWCPHERQEVTSGAAWGTCRLPASDSPTP